MTDPIPRISEIGEGEWQHLNGNWYVRPPGTDMAALVLEGGPAKLSVEDHGDGTITVHGQIIYDYAGDNYQGTLTAGVWDPDPRDTDD